MIAAPRHAVKRAARDPFPAAAANVGPAATLSNLVSNVPAAMLLLPAARHQLGGPVLALAATLAGIPLIVGSIVVEQARRLGVRITWRDHARLRVPSALLTLAIAAGWLWLRAARETGTPVGGSAGSRTSPGPGRRAVATAPWMLLALTPPVPRRARTLIVESDEATYAKLLS